jgi:hypothetical protein
MQPPREIVENRRPSEMLTGVRRGVVASVLALLIAAAPTSARMPSLQTCVARWNSATLGTGRMQIKGVAANGRRALMFGFADGACGIAFPTRQAAIGGVGEFATALGGDYDFRGAPFGGGTAYEHLSSFEQAASRRKNVSVSLRNGRVRALHHARIVRSPLTAIDTAEDCAIVTTLEGDAFDVTRRGVGCALTRVVLDAWTAGEGRAAAGGARTILTWRCTRSDDGAVSCADGERQIDARRRAPVIVAP